MTNKIILYDNYAEIEICSDKYGIMYSKIDLCNVEKIKYYHWGISYNKKRTNYYVASKVYNNGKYKTVYLHRLIMGVTKEYEVDHKDHNTLNNLESNLQTVCRKVNMENIKYAFSTNKSGNVRGVSWSKDKNKWRVTAMHNGKQHFGGYFTDIKEAETSAINLRNKLFTNNLYDSKGGNY